MSYDVFYLIVGFGFIVIFALTLLIIKAVLEKKGTRKEQIAYSEKPGELASEAVPETPKMPERPETEQERLKRMEKELAEREEKQKSERVRELEEREKVIKQRESQEKVVNNPKVPEKGELEKEKERVKEMIKKAEERFAKGELEESNFKRIVSDYQNQIIDLDIKIRRQTGERL